MGNGQSVTVGILADDLTSAADGTRPFVMRGMAPAFPAAGRATLGGIQLVDGLPVAETVYGRDPVHPARHSALAALVPDSIGQVVLLDAATQSDLDARVAAQPDPESILWDGSPGVASALSRRLAPAGGIADPAVAVAQAEILVVVGTANLRSHRQAEALRGTVGVTVLQSPGQRPDDAAAVLSRIADAAAARVGDGTIAALIATGGDTMEAIMNRLGIEEFEVLQELEPGFPLGLALMAGGRRLLLAMKAGGFGDDETLHRAVARLRGASPSGLRETA